MPTSIKRPDSANDKCSEIKGENVETLDIWVPPLTNGVLEFVEAKLGQSSLVQFSHILFVLIFVSYTGHYA